MLLRPMPANKMNMPLVITLAMVSSEAL